MLICFLLTHPRTHNLCARQLSLSGPKLQPPCDLIVLGSLLYAKRRWLRESVCFCRTRRPMNTWPATRRAGETLAQCPLFRRRHPECMVWLMCFSFYGMLANCYLWFIHTRKLICHQFLTAIQIRAIFLQVNIPSAMLVVHCFLFQYYFFYLEFLKYIDLSSKACKCAYVKYLINFLPVYTFHQGI